MTQERKIKILEDVKLLLPNYYKEHGICSLFYLSMTIEERKETKDLGVSIVYHLGIIFIKNRPSSIYQNYDYWWRRNEEGLKIRLSVIDKMISELKSQMRP